MIPQAQSMVHAHTPLQILLIHPAVKGDGRIEIICFLIGLLGKAARPQFHCCAILSRSRCWQNRHKGVPQKKASASARPYALITSLIAWNPLFTLALRVENCLHFNRKAEEVDKALRILLIIYVILIKGCERLTVEGIRGGDARIDHIALVELELYVTRDRLLRAIYKRVQRLAQR